MAVRARARRSNSSLLFFLGVSAAIVMGNTFLQNQPLVLRSSIKQCYDASIVLLLTRRSWHPPSDKRTRYAWEAWGRLLWVVIFVRKSNKGVCFGKSFSLRTLSSHSHWPQSPNAAAVLALAAWKQLVDQRDLLREVSDSGRRERMRAASEHSDFLTS